MKTKAFLIAALVCFAQATAQADLVSISGSGTWGPDAPLSDYSAPGNLWSFSFDVPNPLDANPTSTAINFQYFLDGSLVNTTLSSVEFFPLATGGLFDLNFDDGNSLNFYGDQAYTSPSLSLIPGIYAANIDINSFVGLPNGSGTGTITITTSAVPEPSSIISGGLGLLALAFWRLRKGAF